MLPLQSDESHLFFLTEPEQEFSSLPPSPLFSFLHRVYLNLAYIQFVRKRLMDWWFCSLKGSPTRRIVRGSPPTSNAQYGLNSISLDFFLTLCYHVRKSERGRNADNKDYRRQLSWILPLIGPWVPTAVRGRCHNIHLFLSSIYCILIYNCLYKLSLPVSCLGRIVATTIAEIIMETCSLSPLSPWHLFATDSV